MFTLVQSIEPNVRSPFQCSSKKRTSSASHGSGAGSSQGQLRARVITRPSRRVTPLVTTSGKTSSKSSRTRSAQAVENRLLRGIARRWERDLQRQKREEEEEEEDDKEVEQEIPAFGQSETACGSERSARHTTSSEQVDYSAFLAPAVRLSRPLESEIGGVYRRVWNNVQRETPHRTLLRKWPGHQASQRERVTCVQKPDEQ